MLYIQLEIACEDEAPNQKFFNLQQEKALRYVWDGGGWRKMRGGREGSWNVLFLVYSGHLLPPSPLLSLHLSPSKHRVSPQTMRFGYES
jgi:hypothetical protein